MAAQFPILKADEVALLRVDSQTGDLLDEKFALFVNDPAQIIYSVFPSLKAAEAYIKTDIRRERTIEAIVYNAKQDVVFYYNPEDKLKLN